MATIPDLTRSSDIQNDDVIPVFDRSNSATRSVSFQTLRNAIATPQSLAFDNTTRVLTLTLSDNTTLTVTIPTS